MYTRIRQKCPTQWCDAICAVDFQSRYPPHRTFQTNALKIKRSKIIKWVSNRSRMWFIQSLCWSIEWNNSIFGIMHKLIHCRKLFHELEFMIVGFYFTRSLEIGNSIVSVILQNWFFSSETDSIYPSDQTSFNWCTTQILLVHRICYWTNGPHNILIHSDEIAPDNSITHFPP